MDPLGNFPDEDIWRALANSNLKTQISIGEEDLLLLVKSKGDQEWFQEENLEKFGPIPQPQWHKSWPTQPIPDLTSPPKGHQYKFKNVHNISSDSENMEQDHKKQKTEQGGSSSRNESTKVTKVASIFNSKSK